MDTKKSLIPTVLLTCLLAGSVLAFYILEKNRARPENPRTAVPADITTGRLDVIFDEGEASEETAAIQQAGTVPSSEIQEMAESLKQNQKRVALRAVLAILVMQLIQTMIFIGINEKNNK